MTLTKGEAGSGPGSPRDMRRAKACFMASTRRCAPRPPLPLIGSTSAARHSHATAPSVYTRVHPHMSLQPGAQPDEQVADSPEMACADLGEAAGMGMEEEGA